VRRFIVFDTSGLGIEKGPKIKWSLRSQFFSTVLVLPSSFEPPFRGAISTLFCGKLPAHLDTLFTDAIGDQLV
jgi:hypothetical protein